MKYYLINNSDFILQAGGVSQQIEGGKLICLQENQTLSLFPSNANSLPFAFCVSKMGLQESSHIHIIDYGTFYILQPLFPKVFTGEFVKGQNFKDLTACVLGYPYKFLVNYENKNYTFNCKEDLTNIQIFEKQNIIYLKAFHAGQPYFILFHKISHEFHEFHGEVTFDGNYLSVLENRHTFAQHGKLTSYEITNQGLKTLSSQTVYLNGYPVQHANYLNHVAFFEAVREKDYNLAKGYLSLIFRERLTEAHFVDFFGEFEEIKPITIDGVRKIALIHKISENYSKAQTFIISENAGLICDITDD